MELPAQDVLDQMTEDELQGLAMQIDEEIQALKAKGRQLKAVSDKRATEINVRRDLSRMGDPTLRAMGLSDEQIAALRAAYPSDAQVFEAQGVASGEAVGRAGG